MIYYFLPDAGKFGGVKVACQLVEALAHLGFPAVIVTPDGQAPSWFAGSFAVIDEAEARARIGSNDHLIITWPPDHRRLAELPGRRICHIQGTDPLMEPLFADPAFALLSCWDQAADYVLKHHGRSTIHVGISVAACFYEGATVRHRNQVSYMPRRGHQIAHSVIRRNDHLDFVAIDEMTESEVAARLARSGYFLATAVGEQFGLPALEAMAAGCLVLSVPVRGGMEYLQDGCNCIVADPQDLPERLAWISAPAQRSLRLEMRLRARATAARYHPHQQLRSLREALTHGLSEVLQ